MDDNEARKKKYEMDKILNDFWQDGWISSDMISKINDILPLRLRYI